MTSITIEVVYLSRPNFMRSLRFVGPSVLELSIGQALQLTDGRTCANIYYTTIETATTSASMFDKNISFPNSCLATKFTLAIETALFMLYFTNKTTQIM